MAHRTCCQRGESPGSSDDLSPARREVWIRQEGSYGRWIKVAISDSTVGIIGTGTIGSTLAANFAAGGQDFLLAGRDQEAARKVADGLDGHAETVSADDAVDRADVLVIAVWLPDFEQLIAQYGARLVMAFGTLSAPTLSAAMRREPERAVLFYAADDDAAGDLVADLIRVSGYEPVKVGGLDQSIRIEMFGDLHEYGALGRAVTKSEALAAV